MPIEVRITTARTEQIRASAPRPPASLCAVRGLRRRAPSDCNRVFQLANCVVVVTTSNRSGGCSLAGCVRPAAVPSATAPNPSAPPLTFETAFSLQTSLRHATVRRVWILLAACGVVIVRLVNCAAINTRGIHGRNVGSPRRGSRAAVNPLHSQVKRPIVLQCFSVADPDQRISVDQFITSTPRLFRAEERVQLHLVHVRSP